MYSYKVTRNGPCDIDNYGCVCMYTRIHALARRSSWLQYRFLFFESLQVCGAGKHYLLMQHIIPDLECIFDHKWVTFTLFFFFFFCSTCTCRGNGERCKSAPDPAPAAETFRFRIVRRYTVDMKSLF